MLFLARVVCFRAFESTELFSSPDIGNVFFVFKRGDGASDVATETLIVRPERALLVVQVQAVVGEEIGLGHEIMEGGVQAGVEGVKVGV